MSSIRVGSRISLGFLRRVRRDSVIFSIRRRLPLGSSHPESSPQCADGRCGKFGGSDFSGLPQEGRTTDNHFPRFSRGRPCSHPSHRTGHGGSWLPACLFSPYPHSFSGNYLASSFLTRIANAARIVSRMRPLIRASDTSYSMRSRGIFGMAERKTHWSLCASHAPPFHGSQIT